MFSNRVFIVDSNIITPYGLGIDICFESLMSGNSAVSKLERFETRHFVSDKAAVIKDLNTPTSESLVFRMLKLLLKTGNLSLPEDCKLFLATTTGEIDLLERSILKETESADSSNILNLLKKIENLTGAKQGSSILVSAACASSTLALSKASMMIAGGEIDSALIIACDCVSEFVFSGFSSLMALSPDIARPFDKNRNGLSLGEAACYTLLKSEKLLKSEQLHKYGEIAGWGSCSDSFHMTGPSLDGSGLAMTIKSALEKAKIPPEDIGSISAHGTGTNYNDTMEINAFKSVFKDKMVPAFSIKGGTGHTLAAAGLLETLITFESMKRNMVLPTVNFIEEGDDCSGGWISSGIKSPHNSQYALKVNAGFGGINAALILKYG